MWWRMIVFDSAMKKIGISFSSNIFCAFGCWFIDVATPNNWIILSNPIRNTQTLEQIFLNKSHLKILQLIHNYFASHKCWLKVLHFHFREWIIVINTAPQNHNDTTSIWMIDWNFCDTIIWNTWGANKTKWNNNELKWFSRSFMVTFVKHKLSRRLNVFQRDYFNANQFFVSFEFRVWKKRLKCKKNKIWNPFPVNLVQPLFGFELFFLFR